MTSNQGTGPTPPDQKYGILRVNWFVKTAKKDLRYKFANRKIIERQYVRYLEAIADAPDTRRYKYDDDKVTKAYLAYCEEKIKQVSTVTITVGKFNYKIDFEKMTQTNTGTSRVRKIGRTGPMPPHLAYIHRIATPQHTTAVPPVKTTDNRVPIWLWERFRNRFDVHEVSANTTIERLFLRALEEPSQKKRTSVATLCTRQGQKRPGKYELSFVEPGNLNQRRLGGNRHRRLIRLLIPRQTKIAALPPPTAKVPDTTASAAATPALTQNVTVAPSTPQPKDANKDAVAASATVVPSKDTPKITPTATVEAQKNISTAAKTTPVADRAATSTVPKLSLQIQADVSSDDVVWQFSNVAGTRWHDLSVQDSLTIEEEFQKFQAASGGAVKRDVSFDIGVPKDDDGAKVAGSDKNGAASGVVKGVRCGRQHYTIDFVKLKQINESSQRARSIRRIVKTKQDGNFMAVPPGKEAEAADKVSTMEKLIGMVKAKIPSMSDAGIIAEEEKRAMRGDKSTYLGQGTVDTHAPARVRDSEVAHTPEDGLLMCMLNKADIKQNNNKFYFMQVLVDKKDSQKAWCYMRYGRVGTVGQIRIEGPFPPAKAIDVFKNQFRSKTGNSWTDRHQFKMKPGNYLLMRIDNRTEEEREAEDGPSKPVTTKPGDSTVAIKPVPLEPPSKLHPLVQDLMKYLTDRSDMNLMMENFSMDVKRMPLGRVTKEQIRDAFTVLTTIEKEMKEPIPSPKKLLELSNIFYTLLPHRVPGHTRLPIIDSERLLQNKIDMVQSLDDIELANELLKRRSTAQAPTENTLDRVYRNLKCAIEPLDESDPVVKRIRHYATVTRGSTHYNIPEVERVFAVNREGEEERILKLYNETKDLPYAPHTNKRMLWHGSRKTNFLGILSQGLRIAPPEAPSTGYMFGKGIYFSDVVSKAANYCNPMHNQGLMLLSEVSLGAMFETGQSKYMEKPQPNTFSTCGVGGQSPDSSGFEMIDGVLWPMGKVAARPHPRVKKTSLLYPEYIIYDPAQYKMKYLVKMRFKRG